MIPWNILHASLHKIDSILLKNLWSFLYSQDYVNFFLDQILKLTKEVPTSKSNIWIPASDSAKLATVKALANVQPSSSSILTNTSIWDFGYKCWKRKQINNLWFKLDYLTVKFQMLSANHNARVLKLLELQTLNLILLRQKWSITLTDMNIRMLCLLLSNQRWKIVKITFL